MTYSSSVPDLAIIKLTRPFELDNALGISLLTAVSQKSAESGNFELAQGREVVAVGYGLQPLAAVTKPGPLVTRGVVSNVVHDRGRPVMFVTTAAVVPGMSGGLVACERTGRPIGMIVSNSQYVAIIYYGVNKIVW